MKNLFYIPLFFLFFFQTLSVEGQTLRAFLTAAEEAFEKEDHFSALYYYKEVLEFDSTNVEALYRVAESARKFNAFRLAKDYYRKVYNKETDAEYPLSGFYLAKMLHRLGEYEEAAEKFGVYLSEYGDEEENPEYTERAERLRESALWAKEVVENPWEEYQIEHRDEWSSIYTDFGAIERGDSVYFSSMRFENPDDEHFPPRQITHIMVGVEDYVYPLPDSINHPGKHTAHSAFNADGSRVYYTVCEYVTISGIRCELFYRDIEDGVWSGEVRLPDTVNLSGYTSTQPNVGFCPVRGVEVLYFVSDRPEGKGGLDIWAIDVLEDGEFGIPYNVQGINTPEDDVTPFHHIPTNTLYFSSLGYKSLGGFDIFKANATESGWGDISHMGYPLNSSFDDLYYTLSDDGKKGIFSSNREGSNFIDDGLEACCFDIYEVNILPFVQLITQTFDINTGDSLRGVTVQLIDRADPTKVIEEQFIPDEVEYTFPVDRDKEYFIVAKKEGYKPDTSELSTFDLPPGEDILRQIYLFPDMVDLEVQVFDAWTEEPLVGATVGVVNPDDPQLTRQEGTNQDSHIFNFDIQKGNSYRILANRKGYISGVETIEKSELDGVDRLIKKIYLERGGLSDYLPLVLYFDNDRPDPRSRSQETRVKYTETFPPYMERKPRFIEVYTEPLEGEAARMAEAELTRFFETEVRKGVEDLDNFFELLMVHLEAGDTVNIDLKGYTSPRARPEYNLILGMRRVNSVKNDFMSFDNGAFRRYIDNGQLRVELESFGETTAPSDVVADLDDERNSIYSLGASKERRVEIIQVRVRQDGNQ